MVKFADTGEKITCIDGGAPNVEDAERMAAASGRVVEVDTGVKCGICQGIIKNGDFVATLHAPDGTFTTCEKCHNLHCQSCRKENTEIATYGFMYKGKCY